MFNGKKVHIYLWRGLEARTTKLALALTKAGADVTVVSYVFEIPADEEYPFEVDYHLVFGTKQSFNSNRFARIAENLLYYRALNNSILKSAEFYCSKRLERHIAHSKPDLAIAINAFMLTGVARGSRRLGIPFAYESYEFWPDHAFDPVCSLNDRQRAFLAQSEQRYASRASLFVTVSEFLAKEYKRELKLSNLPKVIYNAPMDYADSITPVHSPLRVTFVGNIVPERNIEVVIDAVSQVEGVELFIQGEGYHKDELAKYVEQADCSQVVHFVSPVPYQELATSLGRYDVGVISYEVYNRHVDGALPNKFFEYMAGGLAMLLTRTHAFEEFENINDFATFIDPNDVSTLVSQLEYLRDNPAVVEQMKKRALEEAKRYCGDRLDEPIIKLYQNVVEGGRS